jgi:hypothetical protein
MNVAKAIEGIPVVSSATERAALFPVPATNQRVQNLLTGNVERWDGVSWIADFSNPMVNIRDFPFKAKGDGVTDDTAAITAALAAAAGKTLVIPPANAGQFYKVAGTLAPAANTTIIGCGRAGEVRQTSVETRLWSVVTDNVVFRNVAMYGQGGFSNAWVDDNHPDIGISAQNGIGLRVLDCEFRNFALAGVYTLNTPDVLIKGNRVEGTHLLGAPITSGSAHQYGIAVTASAATNGARILGNDISNTCFGIDASGATTLKTVIIADNNVHDTRGQHALYVGAMKMVIVGNSITEFQNHGIKLFAGQVDTQRDIICSHNHIASAVANGFGIVCAAAAGGVMTDTVIVGNQIRNLSATPTVNGLGGGVVVEGAQNVLIGQNLIRDVFTIAISVDNVQVVTDITIDGNVIISPAVDGININAPAGSSRLRITNNKLSAIPAAQIGIRLASAVDDVVIAGNSVVGGINSVSNSGSATNVKVVNNVFSGWASEPMPLSAVPITYEGNQDGKEFTTYAATASIVDYDRWVGINAVGGVVILTVPTAVGRRGRRITFIKTDASANAVTISCPSVNINNAASQALAAQFNKLTIQSNNGTWFIVA